MAVLIDNTNDYKAPSQSCIKGVKTTKKKETPEKLVAPTVSSETVKVSVKDCLACSGCITSEETVILQKQSLDELLLNIIESGKAVIISLSPQSRASLAANFGLSSSQVFRKLTTFFKSLGVKAVYDTSCSRDLVLIEACNEFIARYKQRLLANESSQSYLPMLSSSCPGWIRYAEKKLGPYLAHISSVKSPQQAIGSIIKYHVCQKMGLALDTIYHVTIMPCYEKKLEAARDDFTFLEEGQGEHANEVGNLKFSEVDSVLTSREVLDLIQLKSLDFKNLEESPLDKLLSNVDDGGHLYGVSGSSGGYAETIFRHAAKTLFGREVEGPVNFKKVKNSDFREVSLKVDGKIVLKFAICYGEKNWINIVSKIKNMKCDYDFLEVMACPSGCLNGGGQIKPKEGQAAKDFLESIERVYMEDVLIADPFENPQVKSMYKEWLEEPGSERAKKHAHTEYRPVVKSITSQLHNW